MNRVIIMGRLAADPSLASTPAGAVARFSLAVRRPPGKGREEGPPDFVDCVAFGALAEAAKKHLVKGQKALVDGSIRVNTWQDKAGRTRRSVEVWAGSVEFLERPRGRAAQAAQEKPVQGSFEDTAEAVYSEAEMPF